MIYCISDVHGEYELFLKLLKKINFKESDTLYILGDIVDKGQNSIKLLKYILSMNNMKCIIGNHEYDFLKFYHALMEKATDETDYKCLLKKFQNYFPSDGHLLDWDTIFTLDDIPFYIEEKSFICVHAGVKLDRCKQMIPLSKNLPEDLVYNRFFKDYDYPVSDKCIIFGHTPTRFMENNNGDKMLLYRRNNQNNSICDYYKIHIDTGVYFSNVLGCLCIDTCEEFYVMKEKT